MKIKTLIKKLQEVEKINPKALIYLYYENMAYDFTGFGCDDNNEVELYISSNDNKV